MIVFAKRSGESLNKGTDPHNPQPFTKEGIQSAVADVRALAVRMALRTETAAARGLVLVTGAGNLAMRGEMLSTMGIDTETADILGMTGTLQNAVVLTRSLQRASVRARLFVPETVACEAKSMSINPEQGTPRALSEAFDRNEVAVFGFGSDKTGQTTDAAVMDHAINFRRATGEDVTVLKGTKFGGVYDRDPAKHSDAQRLSVVSAEVIQHEGWTVVDPRSLEIVQEEETALRVHGFDASLIDAAAGNVGTLIVPEPGVRQYA